jgi:hypothetical protein
MTTATKWAAQARHAIDAALRAAKLGKGQRTTWIVITSSYPLSIDPDTADGRRIAEALSCGDLAAALDGVEPAHTEVGFRYAQEAKVQ